MSLSAIQLRAIDVLLTARTQAAAAKKIGVDPATVRRWMKEPEFLGEMVAAQRQAIRQNVRGITGMAAVAIRTLTRLMQTSPDDEVKLKAAQEALERLFDADLVLNGDEDSEEEGVPGSA